MPPVDKTSTRILVVDDDLGQRSLIESYLTRQGFNVTAVASGEAALEAQESTEFSLMISDVRMPGISGLELLRRIRSLRPGLPVLLVTAFADIRDAVEAMRDGAVNYLEKPIDLDELTHIVHRSVGIEEPGRTPVCGEESLPEGIIAQSPQMAEVLREAALVAPSETRVLVTGESGVGKEVLADVIHAWSPRAGGPLTKVNCAAIPEALLESELFGHEKGAFTGATNLRIGRFEQTHGGTILMDEIAEMSPALQAKLLRITQDGAYQRIGSNEERRTDVRIIAATNRNLDKEVAAGRFREDLFYRLNVMEIYVPPLRERRADILPLAEHFVAVFSEGRRRFSPGAATCLELYDWPGNVRELRNAMERATLMARGDLILPEHLPKRIHLAGQGPQTAPIEGNGTERRMEDIERAAILQALRDNDYNRTESARALGISRRALTYKIRRYREQGHVVDG
jgi:DNA-binding NtrC family response regulator